MELSLFLGQLFGLTFMIFTALAFFRPKLIDGVISDLRTTSLSVMMASFVTIVAGLAVVLSHNIWEMSWVGIITFFGWASLIKGISFIAFPNVLIDASNKVLGGSKRKTVLFVAFLLGCYLAYKGFGY